MENTFGDSIKRIRGLREMSQRTLAQKSKTSQSAIARIEGGDIDPRISTVKRILGVLDGWLMVGYNAGKLPPPTYLFDDDDDDNHEDEEETCTEPE